MYVWELEDYTNSPQTKIQNRFPILEYRSDLFSGTVWMNLWQSNSAQTRDPLLIKQTVWLITSLLHHEHITPSSKLTTLETSPQHTTS